MKLLFLLAVLAVASSLASSHKFHEVPLVPDFHYLEYLSFETHSHCICTSTESYTLRHFWNHVGILNLSLMHNLSEERLFFNWLTLQITIFEDQDQGEFGAAAAAVDENSINDFNRFLETIIVKPVQPYPDLYSSIECLTLNQVFFHEFVLWGMPRCVVDMYSRNLLIFMYRFLCKVYGNLFNEGNLHHHFTRVYNSLTNHDRFAGCGDIHTYSHLLSLVDAQFCSSISQ